MTIRERINGYKNEMLGDLLPDRAAEILTEMSALTGNISDEILKTEVEYHKILLDCLKSEKSANRARITAEITPEYIAMKEAKNTERVATEMIRSLKYYLKVKANEMENLKF